MGCNGGTERTFLSDLSGDVSFAFPGCFWGAGRGGEILGVLTAAQEGGGHTLACLIQSLPKWTALYSQIDTLVFLGSLGSPKMQRRGEEAVCNTKQCAGRFTACSGQPFSVDGLPSTKALGSLSRFLFFSPWILIVLQSFVTKCNLIN